MLRALDETRDRGRRDDDPGRRRDPRRTRTSSTARHSTNWVEERLDLSGAVEPVGRSDAGADGPADGPACCARSPPRSTAGATR